MMLTTKGRYAVMAMVDLAYYGSDDKPVALHEISARQDITVAYLEQLFNKLKKHNLVNATRGSKGGYTLFKAAEFITILSIIEAVGENTKITRCSKSSKDGCLNNKKNFCFTHSLWEGLGNQINDYLTKTSLKDICNNIKEKDGKNLFR